MKPRPYSPAPYRRRRYLLIGLFLLPVTALLIPATWSGSCISLVQVLVPLQHAASIAADSLAPFLDHSTGSDGTEDRRERSRTEAALRHQVASLALRVAELEREVEVLTATRLWGGQRQRLGARGRLIPARVISDDLLAWRSSKLITSGSLQGVRRGSAVGSCYFSVDQGEGSGIRDGLPVLLKEQLVGFVEQVGTHTARVKLLSDPTVSMKVRIGRLTGAGLDSPDTYFWLTGRGNGRMVIRDVDRRLTESASLSQRVPAGTGPSDESERSAPRITTGDIVLSDPMSDVLPAAMTIGTVTRIDVDQKNPLLAILTVESGLDGAMLRRVYVYVPETEDQPGPP